MPSPASAKTMRTRLPMPTCFTSSGGAIWPSAPDAVTTSLAAAVADPARPPSPLVDGLGAHRVADALAALAARAVRRA